MLELPLVQRILIRPEQAVFGENYVVTPPIVFARAFLPPFALPDAQSRNFPNHVGLFLQSHE